MSIDVRYTPYILKEGHWGEQRDRLGDVVTDTIEKYDPGFGSRVTHRTILTPLDYERDYGLPEGSIYHGQMSLDQLLFMRPVAGSQGGLTPLPGLYLCGAGIHPGGGVTGLPGYHAARQVLKSMG
jgi:phytoene dehydrogenase-like protein